jgi:CheY-like chemotaxis protein
MESDHKSDFPIERGVVLLVEDREEDVFFLRRAFSRMGAPVDVRVVGNGAEAQAYLSGEEPFQDRSYFPAPDIVVCDFKMPRRSGVEFLQWMRKQKDFEALPFVLLSGSALPHEKDLALHLGADLYLRKTADFSKMMEHAQMILRLMQQQRSDRARPMSQDGLNRQRLVLMIDDDPKVRRMVSDVLEGFGFDVMPAETSAEALACAQLQQPDVVLCDVILPDAVGFDTARQLDQLPGMRQVPILFITGFPYMQDQMGDPKRKILLKPMTADKIVGAVMEALNTDRRAA